MAGIFDSHAHYDDGAFDGDREELFRRLPKQGVVGVLNVGCTVSSSRECIRFAKEHPCFWAAVGIHPEEVENIKPDWLEKIEGLLSAPKVVAVGEIGLDYHYGTEAKELQKSVFEQQLLLANRHSLPVVIHSRDATQDTMEFLHRHHPQGVLHCFSGSVETAKEVLKLGMYIGFTGVVSFKNAKKTHEVAKMVPLDRLLLETDCPYMAPVPYRGERSTSDMIAKTAEAIALLRGIPAQEVIDAAYENTLRLFSIPDATA